MRNEGWAFGVSATQAALCQKIVEIRADIAGATPNMTSNASRAERVVRRVVCVVVVKTEMERLEGLPIAVTTVVSVSVLSARVEVGVVFERITGARLRRERVAHTAEEV